MMYRIFVFIFCLMLGVSNSYAQKYSNEFLNIGIGAKAQGLGNAQVATVMDVTAAYWNPAGLVEIDEQTGLQLSAMHSEWFAGVGNFDYLGVSLPMKQQRRIALSMIRFGIDGIPNTLSLYEKDGSINYNNIIEFSAADYAFLLSYAQALRNKNLSIGGNVKIVRRIIGRFANSWGFGVDLGAQYKLEKLQFGILVKDIATTFNAWNINFTEDEKVVLLQTGNELPNIKSIEITRPGINLGAAYLLDLGAISLTSEANFVVTTDGKRNVLLPANPISLDLGLGLELGYKDAVFLRAGVDQFQKEENFDGTKSQLVRPSLGVGLKVASFRVDYAYSNLGDKRNTYSHVISLLLDMKKRKGDDE